MFKYIIIFLIPLLIYCEQFSINSDGVNRNFNAYFPMDTSNQTPMIILMHGLGGNAFSMESLNDYFLDKSMVTLFPQAYYYENLPIFGSTTIWNAAGTSEFLSDVSFIENAIDYMVANYSFIDSDRIYAAGMSNGGFMAYRLACDSADKIAAFASVTGHMWLIDDESDCIDQTRKVPIMQIHGTLDEVVPYYEGGNSVWGDWNQIDMLFDGETIFIDDAITFWTEHNLLHEEITDTLMYSDNNLSSIKYTYLNNEIGTQFVHIKVNGGYHDWFENDNGNWGFESHEEIYNFFHQYDLNGYLETDQNSRQENKKFTILKNYPNPFNPSTQVNYYLQEESYVKLEIYDLLGNFINELVAESQKAGSKTVMWDSKNYKGETVPAGVYFCLLKLEKYHKTVKMILLK